MFRTALICALLLAAPAGAQGMDATYDLSLRGVTGGVIALRGRDQGGSYSVASSAKATGMVGALVNYAYEAQAQGRISNGRHVSTQYREIEVDDGERTGSTTRFSGTTPASVAFDPPRPPEPFDIDPTEQRGVIDPLTALYLVLRPTDPARACNARFDTFDGRHVARLTVGAPQARADGTLLCRGRYARLRGYSAEELARRPEADLTFVLDPVGGGQVQVREIRSSTRLGDAVLRRR